MTSQDRNGSTQEIVDYIASELVGAAAASELSAESDLLASGLLDSLAVMRLVTFIERLRGVTIHPADVTIENFMTVNRIVAYLESSGGMDGREAGA